MTINCIIASMKISYLIEDISHDPRHFPVFEDFFRK